MSRHGMRGPLLAGGLAVLLAACQAADDNAAGSANEAETSAPAGGNLAAVLAEDPRFAALVAAAGMTRVLEGKEPYTLLVPTTGALDALPAGTLDRLQTPEGKGELTALLRRHVLPGTILTADIDRAVTAGKGKATLASMAGDPLTVTRDGDAVRIADSAGGGARLVGPERPASNGVVHRIDAILSAPRRTGP